MRHKGGFSSNSTTFMNALCCACVDQNLPARALKSKTIDVSWKEQWQSILRCKDPMPQYGDSAWRY